MSKVSIIVVIYEGKKYIRRVFDAIFAQTHQNFEVIAVINKSTDGGREELVQNYPQVKIIEPGKNTGFARGNNLGIQAATGEYIQLVNQDLILEPNYVEEMLKAFADPQIAAATGKILRYDFEKNQKTQIIDTTGITMSSSGRARDRGQLEVDRGQYDNQPNIFGVSGAGPMYRRSALERVAYQGEIFDENFFMYWEDVDLSWRLNNAGFKNVYVPAAVGFHGRTAGQSEGGYLKVFAFIKHHGKLSKQVLRWNYKNHILMYIKNAKHIWHPAFVIRELAMLGYIVIFETSTLAVIPELFQQIPETLKKRQAERTKP